LARPGGNITGLTNFELSMAGKWLELLKKIAPTLTRVAVILHPETAAHVASDYECACRPTGGCDGATQVIITRFEQRQRYAQFRSGRLHCRDLPARVRAQRICKVRDCVRVRYKFMGELQSLPFGGANKLCHAGDVSAGVVDAGDEAKAHRVIGRLRQ
jgi:hypothetical protein